jgi:hypothetical protein
VPFGGGGGGGIGSLCRKITENNKRKENNGGWLALCELSEMMRGDDLPRQARAKQNEMRMREI